MQKIYRYVLIFLLCAYCSIAFAGQNYVVKDAIVYHVRYLMEVRNANQPALNYSLKFPLFFTQDLPPYQKLLSLKGRVSGAKLQTINNFTGLLSFDVLKPGQKVQAEIFYTFVNYAINYNLLSVAESDSVRTHTASEYLKEEAAIESASSQIINLAENITAGAVNQLDKAKRLFAYVNDNLLYTRQSGDSHSALQTLRRGWGSCEDYSLLYIALCRAVGIPSRYVSGYRFSPREVGRHEVDLDQFAHAWVEINLPETGWITVEPTYTYTVNDVKKVNYDFFGRILSDDRHLFFSYSRQQERLVTWNYESSHPTKVTTDFHIFIRKE